MLVGLGTKERRIAERRSMADVEIMLTLEQLRREFGVSRERVRQLEVHLKLKLAAHFRALSRIAGARVPDIDRHA